MRKWTRGIIVIALSVFMLFGFAPTVVARVAQETITVNYNNIRIAVDGTRINTEFEPFVFQGRTYLPVRDVANAMGFGVTWEGATNTVHLTAGAANPEPFTPATGSVRQQAITVNFNNIRIAVNGTPINTEFDPFIFGGRTYLPVRDVADAMGFEVTWEAATSTVHLTARAGGVGAVPNYPGHVPNAPATPQTPTQQQPPAANTGGPVNQQQAIDLARAHLNTIGRGNAAFRYAYADMDNGRPVWSIEFAGGLEFYVCRNTGTFFKWPNAAGQTQFSGGGQTGGGATTPSPGGAATPSPSPGGSASPSPGGAASPSPGGWASPSPGGNWSQPPQNPPPGGAPDGRWTWDGSWTWTNTTWRAGGRR